MSVQDTGYLDFFGEKCVYVQEGMNYILVPVNEKANIFPNILKKDYIIEYSTPGYKKSAISVHNMYGFMMNSAKLELNYMVDCHTDESIDCFIMTGNEIDEFFSPLEHYFRLKQRGKYSPSDLLYNQEKIAEYRFSVEGKEVCIELLFGNVLRGGISSDLTIHPQLKVNFENTKDTDFLKTVYDIIIIFLQFVHRKQVYNINHLDLCSGSDSTLHHIGCMCCSLFDRNIRPNSRIDASFVYYKDKISNLLEIIASNYKCFPVKHLIASGESQFSFTTNRFAALCSAFEYEYKLNKEYPQKSSLDFSELKTDVIEHIEGITGSDGNTKLFKEEAVKRINELGGQPGFKQKIINAYNFNEESLKGSIEQSFLRIKNIGECAGLLASLRGKVLHNDIGYTFNEKEMEYIRFLDILQFIMTLRRASFTQSEIEIIIGLVFHCNIEYFKAFDTENHNEHKQQL